MDIEIEVSNDIGCWDQLNQASRQGSTFSSGAFIKLLGLEPRFWLARYKGRSVLGAMALFDGDAPVSQPTYLTMYQGILIDPSIDARPAHSRIPLLLDVCHALLDAMATSCSRISFSLHPTFPDIRALQWFNYSRPENGQFEIMPRYTAVLSIAEQSDAWTAWVKSIRDSRRSEHSKAMRSGLFVESLKDPSLLLDLYVKTFGRHGTSVPAAQLDRLHRIAKGVIVEGNGLALLARRAGEAPLSAVLFLRHESSAFYLIGANDPEGRSQGAGSFLMIESIKFLASSGVRRIDMCGANSPHRGDFKTSLNAELVPYFDVAWKSLGS
jgi:hypothetical protein